MRLDRCLGNFQWIDAWSLLECSTLPRISSDHCPLLVSFSKLTITPKAPFRFHSLWLDHQDFFPLVEDVWKSSNFYGCPMYVLGAKLRVLKSRIKVWNKSVFGDVNMNVDKTFDALDEIQKEISSLGPSEERFTKEDNASLCVQNALIAQEKFYRDKSRIKWLSEGDNNTSFFHSMVKIRKLHRSLAVMRDGNRVLDNQMDISQHVVTYFQDLFSADSSVTDTGLVARIIPKVVTATENESLLAIPTPDEIFETLKSMDHSSSPGPDGFGGSFYFRCWPIVGNDVVQAVQSFFSQGNILPHFNSNLMILIPKVYGANSVNHLRPIALANFSFKIITKILADRLSPIAAHIVSPQQNAFTKGRSIVDPIILTSECMNLLDRRCRGGNIAIKFDIRKAFDTLDWGFLLRVLDAFGFSAGFVDWICSILTSAHLSVFINGSVEGFFPCSRGVRQGDPLSPILFCLAEEVFSRGLTRMVEADLIDTFSVPMGIAPPSHVLFADDIMVFMRGTKRSMRNLMRFVEEYSLNSGQCINKLKSLVFLGKYASSRHAIIQKVLGVSRGNLPFTYLGVPIFQGRPKRIYFQAIADKIRCKLTAWKGSLLSQAGRLQLINSVIQGILVYSFQIYAWPTNLLREVQGWIRNFFWSGDPLKRVALWKWIFILFGKPYDPWQCIEDIFYGSLVSSFPTSVRKLWLLVICNFFWWLWHKRNKIRFENKSFSIVESQRCLLRHWRESASTCFSSFTGCVSIPIFSMLRISSLSLDALNFVPVFWRPPPVGWIKINTDGSCKGNGHVGSGGVFRDSSGLFLGAFASSSSYPSAVVAEIVAVIEAIQIAWDKKWHNIWLETDSMHVISLLSAHSMDVPWFLKVSWANCLWHIARLNLRFSHIFREGNCLADAFANFGAMNSSFTWWDSVPDFANASYRRDCVGLPFFRSSS
ncbi:hypothetical protein ACFX19_025815 [Malus domestica]